MKGPLGKAWSVVRSFFHRPSDREPAVHVALSDGHELTLDADDHLIYVVQGLTGGPHERPKKG